MSREQPWGKPSGGFAQSGFPSVEPSTLGYKSLFFLASLVHCYNTPPMMCEVIHVGFAGRDRQETVKWAEKERGEEKEGGALAALVMGPITKHMICDS